MALNKRTYQNGVTVITASNLNEIQDCIIAIENSYVPKTRTINSKALTGNISLTPSDVGAVPTSRTVNGKALSSNISLTAADVSAVSDVSFNETSAKFRKTIGGTTSDIVALDASPTSGSKKPVQSGGVFTAVNNVQSNLLGQIAIMTGRVSVLETFENAAAYLGNNTGYQTLLDEATDYNTLKTPGTYMVENSDDAALMTNCPLKIAHKMYVIATTTATGRACQWVIGNSGNEVYQYVRHCGTSTWTDWRALVPIRVSVTVSAGSGTRTFTNSYIPNGGKVLHVYFTDPLLVGSDVVFETSAGSMTVNGTFNGSVTMVCYIQ